MESFLEISQRQPDVGLDTLLGVALLVQKGDQRDLEIPSNPTTLSFCGLSWHYPAPDPSPQLPVPLPWQPSPGGSQQPSCPSPLCLLSLFSHSLCLSSHT